MSWVRILAGMFFVARKLISLGRNQYFQALKIGFVCIEPERKNLKLVFLNRKACSQNLKSEIASVRARVSKNLLAGNSQ